MRLFFPILSLIILIIALLFSLLNTQTAELFYFFGKAHPPVCLLVITSFILGALIGLIFGFIKGQKLKKSKNKFK